MTEDDYAAAVRAKRAEKDEFLADNPQSPLPDEEREEFDGLDYFDPDPDYRVEATARLVDDPDPVEMEASDGPPVRYLRAAEFDFDLRGESLTLTGYRQDDEEGLFVPFRDKTTGQQTYGGGRYMDLHPEDDLSDGDSVTLDFNLAYTPFCAFSDAFACPLPPEENWLPVAVAAGERTP